MRQRRGRELLRSEIPSWVRIDDAGRIWTTHNRSGWPCAERRAEIDSGNGYLMVSIQARNTYAHRLVYAWFYGHIAAGVVIRHLNGDPHDNRPANLAAGSYADNAADTVRHGRTTRGERDSQAVLTDSEVVEIRTRYANGERQRALAAEFGVDQSNISCIVTRRSWRHI